MNFSGSDEQDKKLEESAIRLILESAKRRRVAQGSSAVHQTADQALDALPQVAVDCKPGCSYCCHRLVDATIPEAIEVAEFVHEQFSAVEISRLRERTQKYTQSVASKSFAHPCPFLVNGLCSIYEKRPLNCRGLASPSSNACSRWVQDKSNPPFNKAKLKVVQSLGRGIVAASRTVGLPAGACELAGSVLAILDHGDAAYQPKNVRQMESETSYTRAQLDAAVSSAPVLPPIHGRGIVTSAGGQYIPSVYVGIRSLRHQGCDLPIQVWHLGPEEMPSKVAEVLKKFDVECIDSYRIREAHPFQNLGGWQNKIFSIMHSGFEEVLYFDADNLALRDPSSLFFDPSYQSAGALFWPDIVTDGRDSWAIKRFAWEFLGLPLRQGAELESGQLMVNKAMCWTALNVVRHMNEHSDFYYSKCTYGDKDTYTLAWALLGEPLNVVPHRPLMLPDKVVRIQFDMEGAPLFQHARKWLLPSSKNMRIGAYRMEDEALAWLEEFQAELTR